MRHAGRRRRATVAALAATLLGVIAPAAGQVHEGVVHQLQIDVEAEAPLCAATVPAMPENAWACVYPSRRHFAEMKELLLRALDAKHRCRFEWTQRDAFTNRAQITRVTCASR